MPFLEKNLGEWKDILNVVSRQEKTMIGALICELNIIRINMGEIKALRQLSH